MSKKNEVTDAVKDLMYGDNPEQIPITTKNNKNSSDNNFVAFRFDIEDKKQLENHFKLKGIINFSEGVRRVIYQYMQQNDLL